MPNVREFEKKQLSEIKEKILVIARVENARKRRQKKRKARRNFEKKKNRLNSPKSFLKNLLKGNKYNDWFKKAETFRYEANKS